MNDGSFEEGPETCHAREGKVQIPIYSMLVVNLNFPTLQDAPSEEKINRSTKPK